MCQRKQGEGQDGPSGVALCQAHPPLLLLSGGIWQVHPMQQAPVGGNIQPVLPAPLDRRCISAASAAAIPAAALLRWHLPQACQCQASHPLCLAVSRLSIAALNAWLSLLCSPSQRV